MHKKIILTYVYMYINIIKKMKCVFTAVEWILFTSVFFRKIPIKKKYIIFHHIHVQKKFFFNLQNFYLYVNAHYYYFLP